MNRKLVVLVMIVLSVLGCKKEECTGSGLYVNSSGPVYEGWPLELYFEANQHYETEVSGPNGFKQVYNPGKTDGTVLINPTTTSNAGKYTVNQYSDNCLVSSGSTTVKILPTPSPNCSIANNTGSTTIGGFGGPVFSFVTANSGPNGYSVIGYYNTYNSLNFQFKSKPLPGIYKSRGSYYPDTDSDNQCAVRLGTSMSQTFILNGQDIYVTEQNGKLTVTMCPSEFSNPVSTTPLYISAQLVEP